MPTIKIPEIKIPKINIPETPYIPETVLVGENPACDLTNRDIELSENPTIIFMAERLMLLVLMVRQSLAHNQLKYNQKLKHLDLLFMMHKTL